MPGNLLWSRVGRITVQKCVSGWNGLFSLMESHQKSLFYGPHESQVLAVWTAAVFLIKPGSDWQDQDCSRSLFPTFSVRCYHRAEYPPYLTFIFIKAWIENFKWAPFIFLLFWKSYVHEANFRDGRENSHYGEPLYPWCLSLPLQRYQSKLPMVFLDQNET